MYFLLLLATFSTCEPVCAGMFYVLVLLAPPAIGARSVTSSISGVQDAQAELRISEVGERLTGSIRYDGQRIVGVSLHHCVPTNQDIITIGHVPTLKTIYFFDLDFTGIELGPLASLNSLESVTIDRCQITDAQLTFLTKLPLLKRVSMSGCEFNGNFLPALEALPRLEMLTLREIKGLRGRNIVLFLGGATRIQWLDLSSNDLLDRDLTGLSNLSKCQYLTLDSNRLTSKACSGIGRMVSLQALDLSNTLVDDGGIRDLSLLTGLRSLRLANTAVGDGLRDLAAFDNLERLDLANTRVGDACCQGIVRSAHVKDLNLSSTLITDQGITSFSKLKYLEILIVAHVGITDVSVATLVGLKNLVRLDVTGTLIRDGIAQFGEHATLAHLTLANTGVGDAGIEGLSRAASLVTLDLSGTRVSDSGVGRLAALGMLEELRLARTRVGDSVAQALAKCPSLVLLDLADTRIGDGALAHLSGIGYLTLSGTEITARGLLEMGRQKGHHPIRIDITGTGVKALGNIKLRLEGGRTVLINPFGP